MPCACGEWSYDESTLLVGAKYDLDCDGSGGRCGETGTSWSEVASRTRMGSGTTCDQAALSDPPQCMEAGPMKHLDRRPFRAIRAGAVTICLALLACESGGDTSDPVGGEGGGAANGGAGTGGEWVAEGGNAGSGVATGPTGGGDATSGSAGGSSFGCAHTVHEDEPDFCQDLADNWRVCNGVCDWDGQCSWDKEDCGGRGWSPKKNKCAQADVAWWLAHDSATGCCSDGDACGLSSDGICQCGPTPPSWDAADCGCAKYPPECPNGCSSGFTCVKGFGCLKACSSGSTCDTGCCAPLEGGGSVCAPPTYCDGGGGGGGSGGGGSECPNGCSSGFTCVKGFGCLEACSSGATCDTGCCASLESGGGVCASPSYCSGGGGGGGGGGSQCHDRTYCVSMTSEHPSGPSACAGKITGAFTNNCGEVVQCKWCVNEGGFYSGCGSSPSVQTGYYDGWGIWACQKSAGSIYSYKCAAKDDPFSCIDF